MREYGKVAPTFWTGETGKAIRAHGPEAVVVAMYLMTSPMSNMLGLYTQPFLYMAHDTGLGLEGATKGLQACEDEGFCRYDRKTETVWVVEMAAWQIAKSLKATDNRCIGIQRDYLTLPKNPFLADFFTHYRTAFHLTESRGIEAPCKPLPSKEQEQEQEQEQERNKHLSETDVSPPVDLLGNPDKQVNGKHPKSKTLFDTVLASYHDALPKCQRITVLNPKRQKRIAAADKLARSVCDQQGWAYVPATFWGAYFAECKADEWLRGDRPNPNNPKWKQNLDVLLAEDRFAQIMDRAVEAMNEEEAP